jgi:biotin synthesis protein BioG
MQTAWLHRHNHRECILFFTGWGMDPAPFRFLPAAEHDLCMFSDYRELHQVDLVAFTGYQRLHLVAWSMGVWVAARLLADQAAAFASATAIGGTLTPVDGQRGIPPESYADMLDHFSQEVLDAFYRNMFDDEDQLARFLANRPQRALPELRNEMTAFRDAYHRSGPGRDLYSHKIITSRDRIFSGRNQMRAWGKGCGTVHNWPHFPFFLLNDWRELLRL